jgi:hypothetical protein
MEPIGVSRCTSGVSGRRAGWLVGAALLIFAVTAPSAGAKILPFRLEADRRAAEVGEPVSVSLRLHPQNYFGDVEVNFGIAVYDAEHLSRAGWPRRGASPVAEVVMAPVGKRPTTYSGSFTPSRAGEYVIVSSTARPDGSGRKPRCIYSGECWPRPIALKVRPADSPRPRS